MRASPSVGVRFPYVIGALKRLFSVVSRSNNHPSLHFIPSRFNLDDVPTRQLSLQDAMLSPDAWANVQHHFGGASGHSVDLRLCIQMCSITLLAVPFRFFLPCLPPGLLASVFSLSFGTFTPFSAIHMLFPQ